MAETTGRTWEKFFADNGEQADISLKDYVLGLRIIGASPDENNSGSNFIVTYNKINLYKKVTVTAAQLKLAGSVPVSILPTPGAGFFISDSKIVVTRAAGGAAYAFGDYLTFGPQGGEAFYIIDNALFNVLGELNITPIRQGQNGIANVAFVLSTIGAVDSATGDKDIDVEIYYTIHAVKV